MLKNIKNFIKKDTSNLEQLRRQKKICRIAYSTSISLEMVFGVSAIFFDGMKDIFIPFFMLTTTIACFFLARKEKYEKVIRQQKKQEKQKEVLNYIGIKAFFKLKIKDEELKQHLFQQSLETTGAFLEIRLEEECIKIMGNGSESFQIYIEYNRILDFFDII